MKNTFGVISLMVLSLVSGSTLAADGCLNRETVHALLVLEKTLSGDQKAKEAITKNIESLALIHKDMLDLQRKEIMGCIADERMRRQYGKSFHSDPYYDFYCPENLYKSLKNSTVFNPIFDKEDTKKTEVVQITS